MQGNRSTSSHAHLRRLQAAVSGDPVPLKPFQCLLLTNANTLFLNDGNALWINNLWVGVKRPRSQQGATLSASIRSVGSRINAPLNWQMPAWEVSKTSLVPGNGERAPFTVVQPCLWCIPGRSSTQM